MPSTLLRLQVTTMSTSEPLVVLRSGVSIPLSVISRLIDLECAGIRFTRQPDGSVNAGPRTALTSADLDWLREHHIYVRLAVAESEAACTRVF